jgi:hypothetical protein
MHILPMLRLTRMLPDQPKQMTIGELRDELDDWPESFEIIFECPHWNSID